MVRAWECSQSKYILPYPLPTALHTPTTHTQVPSIASWDWSPSGKETLLYLLNGNLYSTFSSPSLTPFSPLNPISSHLSSTPSTLPTEHLFFSWLWSTSPEDHVVPPLAPPPPPHRPLLPLHSCETHGSMVHHHTGTSGSTPHHALYCVFCA